MSYNYSCFRRDGYKTAHQGFWTYNSRHTYRHRWSILFKFPNNFCTGGVSGISVILGAVSPFLSAGGFVLLINTILFLAGFIFIGRGFGLKTVYCSTLMSVGIYALETLVPLSAPLTTQPIPELLFVNSTPESMNLSKYCTVITSPDYEEQICDFITHTLKKTATVSNSYIGAYDGDRKSVLLVALTRKQAIYLKKFVKDLDEKSFIIINNTSEISGRGFHEMV